MAFLKNKKLTAFITIAMFCTVFSKDFSLDLQSITQNSRERGDRTAGEKPVWAASGLNLLVPGTGYFYLGEKRTGAAFLTADILLWSGFFYTHFTSRERYYSSIAFARLYAGTQSTRHRNDEYWSHIGNPNFMRTQDFNWAMLNNRETDKTYTDAADQWSWQSEELRDQYAEMRRTAGHWQTASTLIVGTLALNRLISFVSARVATKRHNDKLNLTVPVISTTADFEQNIFGISLNLRI